MTVIFKLEMSNWVHFSSYQVAVTRKEPMKVGTKRWGVEYNNKHNSIYHACPSQWTYTSHLSISPHGMLLWLAPPPPPSPAPFTPLEIPIQHHLCFLVQKLWLLPTLPPLSHPLHSNPKCECTNNYYWYIS